MNNIECFKRIYEKYYKSVVAYFAKRFDKSEAEDLAQTVFMKLWAYLPSLEFIKNEKSLVFKIAKNVLNDRLRKLQLQKMLEEQNFKENTEAFDDITSVEMQELLSTLGETDREIVTLKAYGWSSREIAKIQGVSPSTVRTRLSELKKKLKAQL